MSRSATTSVPTVEAGVSNDRASVTVSAIVTRAVTSLTVAQATVSPSPSRHHSCFNWDDTKVVLIVTKSVGSDFQDV